MDFEFKYDPRDNSRTCVLMLESEPLTITGYWTNFSNCSENVDYYNQRWERLIEMSYGNNSDCIKLRPDLNEIVDRFMRYLKISAIYKTEILNCVKALCEENATKKPQVF